MRFIYTSEIVTQAELDKNKMHPGIGRHKWEEDNISFVKEYILAEEDVVIKGARITSKKLDKLIEKAKGYMDGGRGFSTKKFETKGWINLTNIYNKEAEKIGANYSLKSLVE